jgi:hypothetical protein
MQESGRHPRCPQVFPPGAAPQGRSGCQPRRLRFVGRAGGGGGAGTRARTAGFRAACLPLKKSGSSLRSMGFTAL